MDPRLQAGLEIQLDKQAQQEHDSSLSGVLGQHFKQADEEEFLHPLSPLVPGPERAVKKILTHPLWKKIRSKISYPGQYARPQRGVPGSHSRGTINGVALPTREQWYDNAMSHRYNKGPVPEPLREILVRNWERTRRGAKRIRKSLAPRGERPTKSYWEQIGPYEKRK